LVVPILEASLDIDGDGEVKALTDGLLIVRQLFNFTGDLLVSGALKAGAPIRDPIEIFARIQKARLVLDIDADGQLKATTDGLLLVRRLFNFTGDLLTSGAVNPEGDRTDAIEIQQYIDSITGIGVE